MNFLESYWIKKKMASNISDKQPINLFDFSNIKKPSELMAQKQTTMAQPTKQVVPSTNFINELDYDIKKGATSDEILNAYPEVKWNKQLVNELIYDIQNWATIEEINKAYPELTWWTQTQAKTQDKWLLQKFWQWMSWLVEWAISQVPKTAWNIASWIVEYGIWAPAWFVWEKLWIEKDKNILYQSALRQSQWAKWVWEAIKWGIEQVWIWQEWIWKAIWETWTNLWASILMPWWTLKKWVWLAWQWLARLWTQWAIETWKFTLASEWRAPTLTEATIWWGITAWLWVAWKWLQSIKESFSTAWLMNPAKLNQAKQMIIKEVWEDWVKFANTLKTPQDVWQWLLDKNIKWSKEEIIQQLYKKSQNSRNAVNEALESITEVIPAKAKELDNARKALDVLFDAYKDDIWNQDLFKTITWYISKLQTKKWWLNVSELNDIKRLIDSSELNPYTLTWKVRAWKSWINNIRAWLKKAIEDIAERNWISNIKMLNNETQVSRFLADAIWRKNDAEMVREMISVFAPSTIWWWIWIWTWPFDSNTTEWKISNFVFWALVWRAIWSTKFKTNVASFINKLTPSDKWALQKFINSKWEEILPKITFDKLSKFKEWIKTLSPKKLNNGTTNILNTNNTMSNSNISSVKPKLLKKTK